MSSEPATKRQKLDPSPSPFADVQDAADLPWPAAWSDFFLIVPRSTEEPAKGPADLVRLPVHRIILAKFPHLKRMLEYHSEYIDESRSDWDADAWRAVIAIAYSSGVANLAQKGSEDALLEQWWAIAKADTTLQSTRLMMYLYSDDLKSCLKRHLQRPDASLLPGMGLTFAREHSVESEEDLRLFKDLFCGEDQTKRKGDMIHELLTRLIETIELPKVTDVQNQRDTHVPSEDERKVCEWLLLCVATTRNSRHPTWDQFWKLLDEWRRVFAADGCRLGPLWVERYFAFLIEAAPCIGHGIDSSSFGDFVAGIGTERAVDLMEAFHAIGDTHSCFYRCAMTPIKFWCEGGSIMRNMCFDLQWSLDPADSSHWKAKSHTRSHHPIFKIWKPAMREKVRAIQHAAYRMACHRFAFIAKE